jgi:CheY-like chemotaxis protein
MAHKPVILLIDDDLSTHGVFQDVLDYLGMELQIAVNQQSALEILAQTIPDAILLDIFLPDSDGYKLLQRIRALPTLNNCPVIATTGYYTTDTETTIMAHGFDALLLKPYSPEQIVKTISEVVRP